jgi:DNA-binding transcriptional LysR family regulator
MEIYQLRAFATVAKLGNLTRAAEALHVTQPAVTAQIKALEEELGVMLFDRRPGRIVLTRAGELLLPDAEQLLTVAGSLTSKAREFKGEVTGQFVVGTVGDPESLRLGTLLNSLLQTLPLLDIKTRKGHSEELRELVATESLHAAFYIGPNVPTEMQGIPLQTLHYRVAAPFPYRQRLLHAGWREMAEMPWIGAPAQSHAQVLTKDMFARQGLVPRFAVEADEYASPHSLVRSGLGLALLSEDVALSASERDEVVIWPHTRVAAVLSFIYPNASEHDPATLATVSQLRTVWGFA